MFRRFSTQAISELLDNGGGGTPGSGDGLISSPRKREPTEGIRFKLKKALFGSSSASDAGQAGNMGGFHYRRTSAPSASAMSASGPPSGHLSSLERSPRPSPDDAAQYVTPPQGSCSHISSAMGSTSAPVPSPPPPPTVTPATAPQQQQSGTRKPAKGLLSMLLRRSSGRKRDATGGASTVGPVGGAVSAGLEPFHGVAGGGNGRNGTGPVLPPPPTTGLSHIEGTSSSAVFDRRSLQLPASPSPVLVRPIRSVTAESPFTTAIFSAAAAAASTAAVAAPGAVAAGPHAASIATIQHGKYQRQSCDWPASGGVTPPRSASLSPAAAAGGDSRCASAISATEPLSPQCAWEPSVRCSEGDEGGSGGGSSIRRDGFSRASSTMTPITSFPSVKTLVTPPAAEGPAACAAASVSAGSNSMTYGRQQQSPTTAPRPVPMQTRSLAVATAAAAVAATAATAPCSPPTVQVVAMSPSFPAAMMAAAAAAQAEASEGPYAAASDTRVPSAAALSRSVGPPTTLHHTRNQQHQNQQHAQHHHYSPQLAAYSHHQQPQPHRHLQSLVASSSDTDLACNAAGQQRLPAQPRALAAMTLGPLSPPVHGTASPLQLPQPPLNAHPHVVALPECGALTHKDAGASGDGGGAFWSGTSAPTASACHRLLLDTPGLLPHTAAFSTCVHDSTCSSHYASLPPLAAAAAAVEAPVEHHPHSAEGTLKRSAAAAAMDGTALPPPPPAAGAAMAEGSSSQLLATSVCTPPAMQRPVWRMEDYALTRRLYRGHMASVYKGRCLRSGLPVALKVYFKARVAPNVAHMVMREAALQLRASAHRYVLKLYGVFQTEELVVFVCELASRGSLAQLVGSGAAGGRCTRLSETQLRQAVLEPLLDALGYLHSKGVCHRDIKPENILFTSNWDFRLADFGVSIDLLKERAVTRAGTADYMAPEVERCPLKANPEDNKHDASLAYSTAADVWSIGILAYELMVGFPPAIEFEAPANNPNASNSVSANSHTKFSFPASVSAGARDFITQALALRPEDRPTAQQLRMHPWLRAAGARSVVATAAAPRVATAGAPAGPAGDIGAA